MITSACLCCQQNTNTKTFFQSFPPPLGVTQFRLNGQCWVWGKVSEDVAGMEIVLFLLEMPAVPCVFKALMCRSGRRILTATVLIKQTPYFVTLCLIYLSPRKQPAKSLHLDWSVLAFWWPICALQVHISVRASRMPDRTNLSVTISSGKQWGDQKLPCSRRCTIVLFGKKLIIIMWIMLTLVPVTAEISCPSQSERWGELKQTQMNLYRWTLSVRM